MPLTLFGREIPDRATVAIVGASRSGRSTVLRQLAADARATVITAPRSWGKLRPQDLGRRGKDGATRLAEALDATALWNERTSAIATLGPTGALQAEFAAISLGDDPVVLVDDLFDRLDPWRREAIRDHLARRATLVFTTHAPELAGTSSLVAVLSGGRPLFFGPPDELVETGPAWSFEVQTSRSGAVAALVEPFAVDVRDEGGRLTFRAREGQETTVRLLLAGYGDIRSFVTRTPTFAEAVAAILARD